MNIDALLQTLSKILSKQYNAKIKVKATKKD